MSLALEISDNIELCTAKEMKDAPKNISKMFK